MPQTPRSHLMISILLWCVLSLTSAINAQQTQAVYDQHFQQPPQNNYQPQQLQVQQYQHQPGQQPQVVQHPQYNYAPPQPQYFVQHQQQYPINNVGPSQDPFLHQQPIPMFQAMPATAPPPAQPQPLTPDNNGDFMHRMGPAGPEPVGHSQHYTDNHNPHHMMNTQSMSIPPHGFSPRRGPPPGKRRSGKPPPVQRFTALLRKKPKKDIGPPIKMMDMNRIPKPPKYPLYDMGSLTMATPPPPPVMHPMAQVPSNNYATFVKSPNARAGGHEGGPPRPPPRGKPPRGRRPLKKQRGRRPPPPNHISRPPNRKPYPGDKKHVVTHGFDHPMASNLDPLVDSPSLGRPLSYDEYMERPSNSFTNDPWNFDPYASKYNSGMNTYAMKYNYDPLGMNSLDKSQSHLDPNKLSYPGDYYTQDGSATPGADTSPVRNSQIGGWDQAPETYRTPDTDMLPPVKPKRRPHKQSSSNPHRSQSQNSFNVYEDNADEASTAVGSESALNPLKLLADANPGMEFSIESADLPDNEGHGSSNKNYNHHEDSTAFYTQQLHNVDPIAQDSPWLSYPQSQPYQDSGASYAEQSSINRNDNVVFDQPQHSQQSHYQHQQYTNPNQPPPPPQQNQYYQQQQPNSFQAPQYPQQQYPHQTSPSRHDYENAPSPHTYDDEAQMNRRKEDYAVHEQPYSNLSDNYSPGGPADGLNIDMMPPHVNAPIFKRAGLRHTRQEGTPMIELEGLNLFQDILNNKNAIGARNHLLRIL